MSDVASRIARLEARADRFGTRLDRHEERLERLEDDVDQLEDDATPPDGWARRVGILATVLGSLAAFATPIAVAIIAGKG